MTPRRASGKLFGFVTTGFNIGAITAPLLFGFVLDYGAPGVVSWMVAALSLLTLGVVYDGARLGQPTSSALAHN